MKKQIEEDWNAFPFEQHTQVRDGASVYFLYEAAGFLSLPVNWQSRILQWSLEQTVRNVFAW